MTLQTLEYFIAVAQHRNFTKAAEACHMTQPALSRAIRSLEEELGCPLLLRSGRTATLTAEGEVCLAEAKRVLQQCEKLTQRVREAGRRNQRPLRLGYVIISNLKALMKYCGGGEMRDLPVKLETVYDSILKTKQNLISGELDAAILPEPCLRTMDDMEWTHIMRSRLYVIVHKENPLSRQDSVRMDELRDQKFIMWREERMRCLHEGHIHACREAGFEPHIVGSAEKMGDMMLQVMLHNGVGLANKAASEAYSGDCRFIPVADSQERFGTVCVWRRDDPSPQLAAWKKLLGVTEKP